MTNDTDSLVHHAFVRSLLDSGRIATVAEAAARLSVDANVVRASLRRLEATHGVVLHPGSGEPWVIHPFSASPTATWVQGPRVGWWAPCMWCACGVATLARCDVAIHARLAGETEPLVVHVRSGEVVETDIHVHFACPPRDAWNNVHHFCATVLPFRDPAEVGPWAERHGLPHGAVVPIVQLMSMARLWYGRHADPDWRKWSIREAAEIFSRTGLTGAFWELEGEGGF